MSSLTDDLAMIPAQTALLGSDRHYPEESPAHEGSVDALSCVRSAGVDERTRGFQGRGVELLDKIGRKQVLFETDYPHQDFDTPAVVWDQPMLTEADKRAILGGNAMELFNLKSRVRAAAD